MIDTLAFLRLGLPCSFFFAINEKMVLKVKIMKSGVTPLTWLLDNLGLLWQKKHRDSRAWLAQAGEHVTLDLAGLSPKLGVDMT